MARDSKLGESSYFLVRYVPDVTREEFLNIGVFVHSHDKEFMDCLFTDDFRRIKRFHADADTALLRELQSHFEQQIKEHEHNLEGFIQEMQESYSNLILVTPPRACLSSQPEAQLEELFARYVGKRPAGPRREDTRMRIKHRLAETLQRHDVLGHPLFEKGVPAEQWTGAGDPFAFDYGYRPPVMAGKPNGCIKLIHALSLSRDNEIAHVLANSIRYARQKEPLDLTAVVEGLPGPGDKGASHSQRILRDAEIHLRPLAELDAYAQQIHAELTT